MSDEGKYITVQEYCELNDLSPSSVKYDINIGDLEGKIEGGVYWVKVKSVAKVGEKEKYITVEEYCAVTGHNPGIIRADIDARDRKGKLENGVHWILVSDDWINYASDHFAHKKNKEEFDKRCEQMIMTTSMFVAGREIEKEIDVITSECVYGMNIFRDIFAAVRDIVGGRSKASEKVLADAREEAMKGLKRKAVEIGADAVIAIDLDYMEMGGGKSEMLVSIASGTAVRLKKESVAIEVESKS